MAARESQQQYIQIQPKPSPQLPIQPQRGPRKKTGKRLEKIIYTAFVVAVALLAILILNKQAAIQTVSMEIQSIEEEANEITKQNVDLTVSVKDLSRYDRIWEKAQALGLTQDSKNVKVVPGE